MSNLVQSNAIESALVGGDLSKLTTNERVSYYNQVCSSLGLNPLTKPFAYINLNGKLTLYATRDATDQLRKINQVSVTKIEKEKIDEILVVTAYGKDVKMREDSATGAVNVSGLKGDALANAFMKAETKAKRRLTLSLCGLGLLDETEIETIKDATPFEEPTLIDEVKTAEPEKFELGDYVVRFGKKLAGQKLKDIDPFELDGYLRYLQDGIKKSGKPLSGDAAELYEMGETYLKSKEFEVRAR